MSQPRIEELPSYLDQDTINASFEAFFQNRDLAPADKPGLADFLKSMRNSPHYMEVVKQELFAFMKPLHRMCNAVIKAGVKEGDGGGLFKATAEPITDIVPLVELYGALFYMAGLYAGMSVAAKGIPDAAQGEATPEEVTV